MDLLHIFVNVVLMSTTAFAQKRRSDPSDRPYLGRKDTHQYALGGYADGWRWYKVEGNGNKVGSSNIESMNLYLIVIKQFQILLKTKCNLCYYIICHILLLCKIWIVIIVRSLLLT